MKRGREYYGCREVFNVEKGEKGSNTIFPIILRLLGIISSKEEGYGREIFGKKIQIKKIGVGKNIKLKGILYNIHPCSRCPRGSGSRWGRDLCSGPSHTASRTSGRPGSSS